MTRPVGAADRAVMIEARDLGRSYRTGLLGGWRGVVHGVDLTLTQGDALALLGPNGAGKSTLLAMLAGLRRPTTGRVTVTGTLGVLPERPALPDGRLRHVLRTLASLQGVHTDVDEVIARLHLGAWADTPTRALSQGARHRAALGQALLGAPQILVLDEPLANLDPDAARVVVDVLAQERDRGATLVVATHQIAVLAEVCDQAARMEAGRLHLLGPTHAFLAQRPSRVAYCLPPGGTEPTEGRPIPTRGALRVRTSGGARRDALLSEILALGGAVLRVEPSTEPTPDTAEAAPATQEGRA